MPHDELLARIEQLEADNRRLATQVEKLTGPADEPAEDSASVPRRGLLKRVGGIALGVTAAGAAGQLLGATPAAAADGQPILMGKPNDSANPTSYSCDSYYAPALEAQNRAAGGRGVLATGTHIGIQGVGNEVAGVFGAFPRLVTGQSYYRAGVAGEGRDGADGVAGYSSSATGVVGLSGGSAGIRGVCANDNGYGVYGTGSQGVTGVGGFSESGTGVRGRSGRIGVHGQCDQDNGYGVFGDGSQSVTGVGGFSSSGTAVHGHSEEGRGMVGICDQVTGSIHVGVHGILGAESRTHGGDWLDLAGVLGDSRDYTGVVGTSAYAEGVNGWSRYSRGGVFAGGAAAVRLVPGSSATPPAGGQTGDLYVDTAGRLWYCRAGNWIAIVG